MEQLLIIEDDIGLNQGLSKALKADDRQIISCQDLKAAKEQLLCGGVSLILLDINLPDGSGLELLREVKENTPYIPVILLTANDTDLDIVDGLERGADDYIKTMSAASVPGRALHPPMFQRFAPARPFRGEYPGYAGTGAIHSPLPHRAGAAGHSRSRPTPGTPRPLRATAPGRSSFPQRR